MKNSYSKKTLTEFGILFGLSFPIFIGWIIPLIGGHSFRLWTLWIGIFFMIFGIFFPRLLLYPYRAWMKIGDGLSWINSRIILGIVFLMVVQPIALIMKLINYDPLRLKKNNGNSYRENIRSKKIDLKRIF